MCKKCATDTPCKKCSKTGFSDRLTFDSVNKTAISVRDGVQEYMGFELGMQPVDKVFTVYRSPATIANAAAKMAGIPLTDEHVDLDSTPLNPVGKVLSSLMIDLRDETLGSSVAVQNPLQVSQQMLSLIEAGKRELSLGYTAELVAHDQYDFEQKNIEPHHLAVVDRGRCGAHCSFIDKGVVMPRFKDAEGNPNLEEIVQIISGLPEAMKKLDMEQLGKVMPMLQEIAAMARTDGQSAENLADMGEGEEAAADAVVETETEDMEKTEEVKDMDKEEVKDEEAEEKKTYADKAFKDAVQLAIDNHTMVIEKARAFVDEGYQFTGKSTQQVMRDALASEYGSQKFSDSELPVAFKLLKQSGTSLKTFGDAKDPFEKLKEKEL